MPKNDQELSTSEFEWLAHQGRRSRQFPRMQSEALGAIPLEFFSADEVGGRRAVGVSQPGQG